MSTAYQTQRLGHYRMNFRGGSLINLRLDGETRRHAGYRFLMRLKVSMVLSLGKGHRGAKIRRRRTNVVLLLLYVPMLLLLRLGLLLLLLMDPKVLRQTLRTEVVG